MPKNSSIAKAAMGKRRNAIKLLQSDNVANHPAATRDSPFENAQLRRSGALDCSALLTFGAIASRHFWIDINRPAAYSRLNRMVRQIAQIKNTAVANHIISPMWAYIAGGFPASMSIVCE
ncbi:hypothetical protein LOC70_23570 [Rhodopirellula sp. JC737]|nr:hypothetical protein [Rhodopirellula sp. JC737]